MRLLGRLLLLLLLAIAAALGHPYLRALWQAPVSLPRLVRELDLGVQPATVYFLSSDAWLTFPVSRQAQRMRVLTNAGADTVPMSEGDLGYILEYELLDANRRSLYRASYAHATRVPPPLIKDGMPVPQYLYADGDLAVAAGQSFQLRLHDLPQTAYIRLRVQPLAPPLTNIAVRVYREAQETEERAAILWTRLSQRRRAQLAADVIYPPELLLAQERLHLLDRAWKPVGPLGIEPPQDTLFAVEGADSMPEAVRPAGLHVSAERLGALPITRAGKFLVGFRPLADTAEQVRLELRQFTERFDQPRTIALDLPGDGSRVPQMLASGLVVVKASLPGSIELYTAEEPDHSALPEPGQLRAYRVQPQAPIQFRLAPGEAAPRSLRLDVRAYGAGATLPPTQRIEAEYRLFDVAGGLIRAGELTAQVQPSAFDRIAATQPIADLSDPARFFFRLPPKVARVEVASRQTLLVNAYTRPSDLPHRTRVPIDYYPWRGDDREQPGWFILRPPAAGLADTVAGEQTSVMLHIQSRPPERNPEVLAGRYGWEALDPQISARGARILVPVLDEDRLRPSGFPAYFQPLRPGAQRVAITAPGVERQLRPELVYLREQPDLFQLRMGIDGNRERYQRVGKRGVIQLPAMAPGQHVIQLETSAPGQWLINYSDPGVDGFVRRMAYRLGEVPLRFPVAKRADDSRLIGARFYSTGGAGMPSRIRASIKARPDTGPTDTWTHLERLYLIAPSAGDAGVGYVLDQQQERISQGQPILIELGNDLPDGPVEIEFTLDSGAAGYLVFYQVMPGEHGWTQGFRERDQR
ncbi:MAG: hypothetical protein AB7I68_07835 [Porticoccaceae bacterium]